MELGLVDGKKQKPKYIRAIIGYRNRFKYIPIDISQKCPGPNWKTSLSLGYPTRKC